MREKILAALKSSRADYTEIRLEESESTQVVFRGRNLETAGSILDAGGIVRCLIKSRGWGIATFNDLSDLNRSVEQAYQCALQATTGEPIELAPIPITQKSISASLQIDFRDVSLAEKKALAEKYNQLVLGHSSKIINSASAYADSFRRIIFATSEGTYIEHEIPMTAVRVQSIARDGDNVQTSYQSLSNQAGFELAQGLEASVLKVAQRSVDLLAAETVTGGVYPVVIDQELAGVFIHEAFGHLSESDFVYENPRAQEMMVLGRRFGKDFLNVFEDGSIPGIRGTHQFDDEGVPTRRNYLIKNGILVGRLHSRETASKMGEPVTGNARALNYRFPPIVRMTNTAIENGEMPFEELIKDIKLGIYACGAYGGQTSLENFSFSSAYAYMIRDGKVAEMVKDVILAGNLFTTLMNIDAIGNDFKWINSAGGCGKGDQYPLPVSFGSPHIRIQDVVIGGK